MCITYIQKLICNENMKILKHNDVLCTQCIVHTVHRVVILQRLLQSDFMPNRHCLYKMMILSNKKGSLYTKKLKIQNTKYY